MAQPNQRAFFYPEMQSLASAIACLFVLYLFLPRLPRGLPRLFCVCPCLPILAKVPFSTRSHAFRAILSFSFLWVCPTKLLLRCWDISSDYPGDGFLYFLSTSVLPLRVKGARRTGPCDHTSGLKATTLQGALSLFLPQLLCFIATLNIFRYPHISVQLHHALYCLLLYFGLEGAVGLISGFTSLLLGLELHPFFDKPFLASSLSEFWGRRWNCLSSYMLRETVYIPILHFLSSKTLGHGASLRLSSVEAATKSPQTHTSQSVDVGVCDKDGADHARGGMQEKDDTNIVMHGNEFQCAGRIPLLARAVAMLATFAASGLIHELIFYCITQTSPTWEVTAFFALHGVATVLEVSARRTCLSHLILPQPIAIMCTLGFIYVSAAWLFMPPVMQSGVDLEMLAEIRSTLKVVMDLLGRLYRA
ncbi:hypothetical protein L7F22_046157 [Adiantum nelumboides]|nr:hypothetical protein [Adiantum nelumboides]